MQGEPGSHDHSLSLASHTTLVRASLHPIAAYYLSVARDIDLDFLRNLSKTLMTD